MRAIILLALLSCAVSVSAQQTADDRTRSKVSSNRLELSAGLLSMGENTGTVTAWSVSFTSKLNCDRRNPDRPRWCILAELELWRLPVRKDPWQDMPPIIIVRPPEPQPDPTPWSEFQLSELELGASTIFTPHLGMEFPLSEQFSVTAFAGAGFQHTAGHSTNFGEIGNFRTTDSTHPVISYGAAFRYGLSDRLHLKLEAQGFNTFEGEMSVIAPDGSVATFGGMTMFTPGLSAGVGIGLN